MTPFRRLEGVAAAIPDAAIDTDVIFPARFLLLLDKQGLGQHLFHDRRWQGEAEPNPDFVLNRPPFDGAAILVAGPQFGSGSSREQAVWALADFGIRCVIAPSFGEIFFANCFKNGVLPIVAQGAPQAAMLAAAEAAQPFVVDLEQQEVTWPGGSFRFDVDAHRRHALLLGLDEIGQILSEDGAAIAAFERRQAGAAPWLDLASRA